MIRFLQRLMHGNRSKTRRDCVRESIRMRQGLTERQIDKTLEDSFPASDPPAWY